MTTQVKDSKLLKAALSHARRGMHIFPCCWPNEDGECGCWRLTERKEPHTGTDVGKAPLTVHGWKDATSDESAVREWWTRWPRANVGMALEASGRMVLDLDGDAAKAEAARQGLPPGPVVTTGRGEHRHYKHPGPGYANRTRQGESEAIDVLVNGYVLVPPSQHRNGSRYSVALSVDDAPLAEAPDWVLDMLKIKTESAPVELGELPEVDLDRVNIPERVKALIRTGSVDGYKSRSEAGWSAICTLLRAGCTAEETAAVMVANPIGTYAKDRGRAWIAGEIGRAQAYIDSKPAEAPTQHEDTHPEEDAPTLVAPSVLQLRREGIPPRDDIVSGVLPRGGMMQILGLPKDAMKTWVMLHLALEAVRGGAFLDTWQVEPSNVLYLSAEGGVRLIMDRLDLMAPEDEPALEHLHIWAPDIGTPTLNITDPDTIDSIVRFCRKEDIALVELDPLWEFHHADENSAQEMHGVINSLRVLTRTANVALALAHHAGKSGGYRPGSPAQGRGSTATWGAVDASFVLDPKGHGKLRVTPQLRWSAAPAPLEATLDATSYTFAVENAPTRKALDPEEVASVLHDGPASIEQIGEGLKARDLPCSDKTVRSAIDKLGDRVAYFTGEHGKRVYHVVNTTEAPF